MNPPSKPAPDAAKKAAEPVSFVRRMGDMLIGPRLESSTSGIKGVVDYLARQNGGDDFYNIKMLLPPSPEGLTPNDVQSRMLFYNELYLLRALEGVEGIPRYLGLLVDGFDKEGRTARNMKEIAEKENRFVLKMECYSPHEFSPQYVKFVNLQHGVIRSKNLQEFTALKIFYNLMRIVANIHERNIIHRDIKLNNVIVEKETLNVKLINFGLGKQLEEETEVLRDRRGSPGYSSPEHFSPMGYYGKPVDMWALGVVLFTMFYGEFPFLAPDLAGVVDKIRNAELLIPVEFGISQESVKLLQSLLQKESEKRPTAQEAVLKLEKILKLETFLMDTDNQVVPTWPPPPVVKPSEEEPPAVLIEEIVRRSKKRRAMNALLNVLDWETEAKRRNIKISPSLTKEIARKRKLRAKERAAMRAHHKAGRLQMDPEVAARKRLNERWTAVAKINNMAKGLKFRGEVQWPKPPLRDLRRYLFRRKLYFFGY